MNLQEKWLEEQKADIVDLESQLTSAQAQAAELQERLADADNSHIDQVCSTSAPVLDNVLLRGL